MEKKMDAMLPALLVTEQLRSVCLVGMAPVLSQWQLSAAATAPRLSQKGAQ